LMLEEGMLGRHLALADVERLSGVSRSFRRWHDSGRQLAWRAALENTCPSGRVRVLADVIKGASAEALAQLLLAAGEQLLRDEAHALGEYPHWRRICLNLAVHSGSLHKLQLLLEHGWGGLVRHQNTQGDSCLHVAVREGSIDMAEALLAADAGGAGGLLALRNEEGATCLDDAVWAGRLDLVRVLLAADAGALRALLASRPRARCAVLAVAVLKGCAAIVTALLAAARRAGVLEELLARGGARLLCYAIAESAISGPGVLEALLQGAGGHARELLLMATDGGESCLCHAVDAGSVDAVRALLKSAAQTGARGELLTLEATARSNCFVRATRVGDATGDFALLHLLQAGLARAEARPSPAQVRGVPKDGI
jgi:hypothetical protein